MTRKNFKRNAQKLRQRRGNEYMRNRFNKVVYLESVDPADNNLYEIKSMNKKGKTIEICLTDGKVISGSDVRYARDSEQQANKRLPHN